MEKEYSYNQSKNIQRKRNYDSVSSEQKDVVIKAKKKLKKIDSSEN